VRWNFIEDCGIRTLSIFTVSSRTILPCTWFSSSAAERYDIICLHSTAFGLRSADLPSGRHTVVGYVSRKAKSPDSHYRLYMYIRQNVVISFFLEVHHGHTHGEIPRFRRRVTHMKRNIKSFKWRTVNTVCIFFNLLVSKQAHHLMHYPYNGLAANAGCHDVLANGYERLPFLFSFFYASLMLSSHVEQK